jgi:hypothetical protein
MYSNQGRPTNLMHNRETYNRPIETITDGLQAPDKYREKLKGYVAVENIDHIPEQSHVRYFAYNVKEGEWKFRTGGLVYRKDRDYVVLQNGTFSWSVQKEIRDGSENIWETKFFKKLSKRELTEIALERQESAYTTQQGEMEKLRSENNALRTQLNYMNSS